MQARARADTSWLTTLAQAGVAGLVLLAPSTASLLPLSGWLGLALFADALEQAETAGHAALCGLAFGAAANAVALHALVGLLARFAGLADPLCWVIASLAWLLQAVPHAVGAALARATRRHDVWIALPFAMVPALALTPQLFPWPLPATLCDWVPLLQLAELGGEPLLTGVLWLAAGALAALWRARDARRTPAVVLLTAIGLPLAYGYARLPSLAEARARAPTLRVGVVQGNVGVDRKHDEREAASQLHTLQSLTHVLEQQEVALTVWGETAYPYPLLRSATRAPDDARAPLANGVRGPLLLGVETYAGFDVRDAKYNSAWLVQSDGTLGARVDKARLLAFGEFVPLWHLLPALRARFASPGFAAGAPGNVRVAGSLLGVLVCYEDLFTESARATVRQGARALVNLTNDAWFGDTRAPHLHELTARLRAVELRRDLVRTVNTGVSSFTAATGASLMRTPVFEVARFVAEVRLLDQQTPYARIGDWVTPCCLVTLLWMLCARRRATNPAQL